jgi:diguanylate cyclase (GGDEF)-like protein
VSTLTPAKLEQIIAIQTSIAAQLSVPRIMQLVVEQAQELTGASGAVVEIAEDGMMVYRAAGGSASSFVGVRLKMDGSLSGLSVRTSTVLRCDDVETDDRVDRETSRKIGLRSMVVAPLRRGLETIGVLKVLSDRVAAFTEDDTQMLRLLAGFIATAMHNAASHERSQAKALHDPLTGLPNRSLFADRLEHAVAQLERRPSRLAVIYIDLDDFKPVNDRHGHGAGDELLVAVAERLRRAVRQTDTVARLGGDEFAVLATDLREASGAHVAAHRVHRALEDHPYQLSMASVRLHASLGVAVSDSSRRDKALEILEESDRAMYAAKRQRRSGAAEAASDH